MKKKISIVQLFKRKYFLKRLIFLPIMLILMFLGEFFQRISNVIDSLYSFVMRKI